MVTNKNVFKNEQGITLIEVLATLVISSMAMALIWNMFLTGTTTSQRIQQKNQIQQESNIVTQNIRMNHLSEEPYTLQINESNILLNDSVIGSGYIYDATIIYGSSEYHTGDLIQVTAKSPILVRITITNKETDKQHEIRTTIQKEGE